MFYPWSLNCTASSIKGPKSLLADNENPTNLANQIAYKQQQTQIFLKIIKVQHYGKNLHFPTTENGTAVPISVCCYSWCYWPNSWRSQAINIWYLCCLKLNHNVLMNKRKLGVCISSFAVQLIKSHCNLTTVFFNMTSKCPKLKDFASTVASSIFSIAKREN